MQKLLPITAYLFLWLFVDLPYAHSQNGPERPLPNQPSGQGQESQRDNEPSQFSIPVRIFEEPEEAERTKRQQEETAQREVDDLAAQQSMAESSQSGVILTLAQTAIAAFGTGALLYSLHLNRKATNAAVAAVAASLKSLEAFKAVEAGILGSVSHDGEPTDDGGYSADVIYQCAGRSFVAIAETHFMIRQLVDGALQPVGFEDTRVKFPHKAVILPGQEYIVTKLVVENGQPDLYCSSHVRFFDNFNTHRIADTIMRVSAADQQADFNSHDDSSELGKLFAAEWDRIKGDFEEGTTSWHHEPSK